MSDKLLPIVPWCKAIIVYACDDYKKYVGSEVTVIKKDPSWNETTWIIEGASIKSISVIHGTVTCPEWALMRIDGGEFEHEKEEQEMKL